MTLVLPRFDRSDVLDYKGTLLRLDRQWDDGSLAMTRVRSDRPFMIEDGEQPTVEWFMTEWGEGTLHIKSEKVSSIHDRPKKDGDPNGMDDELLHEAKRVQFVLQALDTLGCPNSRPAIKRHLEALFIPSVVERYGEPPSPSTVRKWLGTRGSIGNRTLENCAPKNGQGLRRRRLDDEVRKLRTDAAIYYWSEETVTLEDAHAELVKWVGKLNVDREKEGLTPVPACSIEWLRVRVVEIQTYDTYAAKFGKPKADAFYKSQGKGVEASRFLEIGIIDHHTFDSYVALEEIGDELLPVGRPTVTTTYDVRTDCITSAVLSFLPPSLFNMLEAIKQANRPKMKETEVGRVSGKAKLLASIYGRYDTILPDNAWEFTGTSGQDSLLDLGCHIDWSRAGMPKDKAKLERWWGTLITYLASKLPGAVFNPQVMKDLGYDPSKDRVVLASDLRRLIAEAVAFYHVNINDGANAQPARLWEDEVRKWETIPVIRDDRQIDQIMGMVDEKTLTTAGVVMFGCLQYTHPTNLNAIIGRLAPDDPNGRRRRTKRRPVKVRVKVKYSPADLTLLHVYDPVLRDYVTLECREEFLHGLSIKHFEVLQAWAKVKNLAFNTPNDRKIARAALNAAIRAAAPEVAMRHRKKFAGLLEKGVGGETSGTVTVAHVPSTYSGMAPVTGHETAVATRTDGGKKPRGPRARKKLKPNRTPATSRAPATTPALAPPQPTSGNVVNFSRRTARPSSADQDWGGL